MGVMRLPRNYRWAYARSREVLEEEGLGGVRRRGVTYLRRRGLRAVVADRRRIPRDRVRGRSWPTSVVIVASRAPEQCYHYRVHQKVEIARTLGVPLRVVDPASPREVASAVQLASILIVFRQARGDVVEDAIQNAKRLGIPVVFEADDIVYRRSLSEQNPNLLTVPKSLRDAVTEGTDGYLAGLRLADHVLASTQPLAADMAREVPGRGYVMENGIDAEMRRIAAGIAADPTRRHRNDQDVVVGYGSGSRAHDGDFEVAAPGLAAVMRANPQVVLHLMGPVRLPDRLAQFRDRVRRSPELAYGEYLRQLSMCDVALAPLLDLEFNRYKSHVKYLEAGLVGVPLVASRTVYESYVSHGVTGLLAGPNDWQHQIEKLISDEELRHGLADAAGEALAEWDVTAKPLMQFSSLLAELT